LASSLLLVKMLSYLGFSLCKILHLPVDMFEYLLSI